MPARIQGDPVDEATRCIHHDTAKDIVAFLFPCCGAWYPCRACHDENADHGAEVWGPEDAEEPAVLCGACTQTMTIDAYRTCEHQCPSCGAGFNPGCQAHWELYFDPGSR